MTCTQETSATREVRSEMISKENNITKPPQQTHMNKSAQTQPDKQKRTNIFCSNIPYIVYSVLIHTHLKNIGNKTNQNINGTAQETNEIPPQGVKRIDPRQN